jgi:hypothetical protein
MQKTKSKLLDEEILDLLKEVGEHDAKDQTVWMDVDSIVRVLMDGYQPGARRQVTLRLIELRRRGKVERCKFMGTSGWRFKKHAADKRCGK